MKVSLEWLREYASLDAPLNTLVRALVDTGTEVDRVHRGLEGVIVVRVVEMSPVPESDRGVRFADIDTGPGGNVRVLTGAPNVDAGDLVPYAPPGTLLPGWDEPLGVRAMFGGRYQSPGMLCSAVELGLGEDADGIHILDRGTPGQPLHEALSLDVTLDVEVTTNRPDCLCHVGIARELAAALGEDLREPDTTIAASLLSSAGIEPRVAVTVDDAEGCSRFAVRLIEGIRVGPSPAWLQRRLRAIGLRPISNIVDVTNYVAHEIGQPLHAFDFDKAMAVAGGVSPLGIVVRRARDSEEVTCLDGTTRTLTPDDIVVCAGDAAASIAGVMGGQSTAVDATTTTVLLESATWDGRTVRATSKRLGLRTDASTLFEKGLPDELAPRALDRAAALMADVGGGHVLDGVVDVRARPLPIRPAVEITGARLSALLGLAVDVTEAATALARLGFVVEQAGDVIRATPPYFRRDIAIPEDIVEEVGRQIGYDNVPSTLPGRRVTVDALAPAAAPEERVRDVMLGAGFDEAITWSFVSPSVAATIGGLGGARRPIPLLNPLTEEWSVMRTSCLPGLLRALAGNLNHGLDDVALFELGRVFWEGDRRALPAGSTNNGADDAGLAALPAEPLILAAVAHGTDAAAGESAIRHLQSALGFIARDIGGIALTSRPADVDGLRAGRSGRIVNGDVVVGVVGEITDEVRDALELRGRVAVAEIRLDALLPERPTLPRYRPPARFPAVVHDIAVVVPRDVAAADALATIREAGGHLLSGADLFDEYRGTGVGPETKSWTFRMEFRAGDRTLTGEEARAVQETIEAALKVRHGAVVRQ